MFGILVSVSFGVLLSEHFNINNFYAFAILIAALVLFALMGKMRTRNIYLLATVVVFLFISIINTNIRHNPKNLLSYENRLCNIEGTIVQNVKYNDKSYVLKTTSINKVRVKEKILITFKKENKIELGTKIAIRGKVSVPDRNFNPHQFNYRNYLKSQGINLMFRVNKYEEISKPSIIYRAKYQFVKHVNKVFDNNLDYANSNFMKSVILAETSYMGEDIDVYRKIGIGHILAVSGLHIGIILFFINKILNYTAIGKNTSLIISIIIVLIYLFFIDFPPGALRALAMYSMGVLSYFIREKIDALEGLYFIATVFLLLNPFIIYSISFLMSFVACWSMLFIYPQVKSYFYSFGIIKNTLALSSSINLGLLPINLYFFNSFNAIVFFANIVLVPIYSLTIALGFLLILLTLIGETIFAPLFNLLDVVLNFGSFIVVNLAKIDFLTISTGAIGLGSIFFIYFFSIFLIDKFNLRKIIYDYRSMIIPYFIYIIMVLAIFMVKDYKNLNIENIYVGQGECTLISYRGKNFLIDTGGGAKVESSPGKIYTLDYLKKKNIKKLDGIFISHFDADHVEGINHLIGQIKIENVFINFEPKDDKIYRNMVENNLPVKVLNCGDKVILDRNVNFKINNEHIEGRDSNDNSMVVLVEAFDFRSLFTGDISESVERNLEFSEVDFLKLPHHGSKTSTSYYLLEKTNPKLAIISAGKNNKFGHPHSEVVERLNNNKINYFRTDKQGLIKISINSDSAIVSTFIKSEKPRILKVLLDNWHYIAMVLINTIILISLSKIIFKEEKNGIQRF